MSCTKTYKDQQKNTWIIKMQHAFKSTHLPYKKFTFSNLGQLTVNFKLVKGKTLRKHSLHEKTAASVLLKLFISSKPDF